MPASLDQAAIASRFENIPVMPILAMKKSTIQKTIVPILHVNENVSLEDQIARRAHELWHQRGHEHGNDLTDWLQAEREINEWHQSRLKKD
jgi:Zn-dependent peptidase ImmA (M78 family)